jgi:hypothetical protein
LPAGLIGRAVGRRIDILTLDVPAAGLCEAKLRKRRPGERCVATAALNGMDDRRPILVERRDLGVRRRNPESESEAERECARLKSHRCHHEHGPPVEHEC